jgi:hypothetical protein
MIRARAVYRSQARAANVMDGTGNRLGSAAFDAGIFIEVAGI